MKIIKACVFLLGIFILVSCSQEVVTLNYAGTQCADPWDMVQEYADFEVDERIEMYLKDSLKINPQSVSTVQNDIGIVCNACTCASGLAITVVVDEIEVNKLTEIGFVVE